MSVACRPATRRDAARPTLLLVMVLAAAGCGRTVETASISGHVTLDGQPVGNGTIAFLPVDGNGPTAGSIIASGSYAVARLAPGPKIVRIEAFAAQAAFPRSRADMEQQPPDQRRPTPTQPLEDPNTIPSNAPGNNSEVTIVRGPQARDFEVTRPAARSPRP